MAAARPDRPEYVRIAGVIERTYYAIDGRPVETATIVVPDVRWEIAYWVPLGRPGG